MRMWMVNTKTMCNQHILGEHGEIHKHKHNFVKQHNMTGRLKFPAQIDPTLMSFRHNQLVKEMEIRGMNHQSPYEQPDVSYLPVAYIDLEFNKKDLYNRCEKCRALGEKL